MKIGAIYSHMNGKEHLEVHKPALWAEVCGVIERINALDYKTKKSREKTMRGKMLFAPTEINRAFKQAFQQLGWEERKNKFYVTHDEGVLRRVVNMDAEAQKEEISRHGLKPHFSYNQTDFLKDRIAVEVQFGKYAFVAHDLFVKHLSFFVSDIIDVGIEILPMKSMETEMSSGVPYYERDLLNVIRQGRGVPAVPLVLIGIEP